MKKKCCPKFSLLHIYPNLEKWEKKINKGKARGDSDDSEDEDDDDVDRDPLTIPITNHFQQCATLEIYHF